MRGAPADAQLGTHGDVGAVLEPPAHVLFLPRARGRARGRARD